MTGAPVPQGADTVVPFEVTRTSDSAGAPATSLTQLPPAWIEVAEPVAPGRHVRRVGEDVPAGSVLATAGSAVGPGRSRCSVPSDSRACGSPGHRSSRCSRPATS
ncbi:hypothetical protein G7075_12705 [Phycicoccus sp. HDW14]|nr:hypothetical protein [Phycicoccus sp. HDW14]QIM21786.1 hypothetical protein G7075_12705 [Phycicoccus sp. HDW14]